MAQSFIACDRDQELSLPPSVREWLPGITFGWFVLWPSRRWIWQCSTRPIARMVTGGRHAVRMDDDGWAIFSQDGSLAAHSEFTITITADGRRILTPWQVENGS